MLCAAGGGCSGSSAVSPQATGSEPARDGPAELAEVQAALDLAAHALVAGDRSEYEAALPAYGAEARKVTAALYRRLGSLPWRRFRFTATAIPGHQGRYEVQASGRLARVGPDDRLAAVRVLDFGIRAGVLGVVADETPRDVRRQYFMAFSRPIVVRRQGLVVLTDASDRRAAEAIAAVGQEARQRLALLRVDADDPLFVAVYESSNQAGVSLGGALTKSAPAFAVKVDRVSGEPWRLLDIVVMGQYVAQGDSWLPRLLAHEMAHAYTSQWFASTRHRPPLLLEGLATAVEGGRSFAPLRAEIAAGNHVWPLVDALSVGDLWMGSTNEEVAVAYLEGAALVLYVLDEWGLERLRPFVVAIANSDLSRDGIDAACRDVLGVGWGRFYSGWREYAMTLP